MQGRTSSFSASAPSDVAAPASLPRSDAAPRSEAGSKRDRQEAIRDVVRAEAIGSQHELADRLLERGFVVTQATVSRDIAELGLVKVPRAGGAAYIAPEDLRGDRSTAAVSGSGSSTRDDRLRRILADIPVTIGRSGLILLVTGSPGTASVIAQAIDESSLTEQEGTLAGDNTLLVLFADEPRLDAWRTRFDQIRASVVDAAPR